MPKFKSFIPYAKHWIDNRDIREAIKDMKSDWITQGPRIDEFEKKVARYCGVKYAVAVSSGTAALHLAYLSAGLGKGDEVITTPITFAGTANAIIYCGAMPVFADIDEKTLNINPIEIENKITPRTRAIVPVDLAGMPCDYSSIKKIAKKHNLIIIEDACHALGAEYKGIKIGGISDMTIFSFHPAKVITTGEGGMVVTNNKEFADKIKILRHHGIVKEPRKGVWYYDIKDIGYNYRITSFQCGLGISQLKKLDKFVSRRRQIIKMYDKAFAGIDEIITPIEPKGVKSAWHIYPIQVKSRKLTISKKRIFAELHKQGVGVQLHYIPIHLFSFYRKKFGFKKGDFPVSERYSDRAITLPVFPKMSNKEVIRVIAVVKDVIKKYA